MTTDAQARLRDAQERARRRAAGAPLPALSDDELTALATVGPEIVGEVEVFVRAAAGAEGVRYWDAVEWDA